MITFADSKSVVPCSTLANTDCAQQAVAVSSSASGQQSCLHRPLRLRPFSGPVFDNHIFQLGHARAKSCRKLCA